jgi:hypothetical protein
MPPIVTRAGLNQVFLCRCCARAFYDRTAKLPVQVKLDKQVVQLRTVEPHPKYPNDAELAKIVYVDTPDVDVDVPERTALECCPLHTSLCSSTRLRFRDTEGDGVIEIVGAEYLE